MTSDAHFALRHSVEVLYYADVGPGIKALVCFYAGYQVNAVPRKLASGMQFYGNRKATVP